MRSAGTVERTQAVVIGGGVIGTAVLRNLAERGVESLLLEAEPSVGEGASKANSAIVHTGFDAKPGSVEASMLARARDLWPAVVDELGIPFLQVGAIMLGRDANELHRLRSDVADNARRNGVETEILDSAALHEMAPYVAESHVGALHVPGESVTDPFWLTRRYAEAAVNAGARIRTGARVSAISFDGRYVSVRVEAGASVQAEQVIVCAGLGAGELAGMAGDDSFSVTPRKGQFLVSEESFGVDRIVLPLPGPMGKGMLLTPIIFGGVLLGPTAEDQDDPTDRATDAAGLQRILAATRQMVPAVDQMRPIRQFAGLRPVSSTGDYVLRPSAVDDRLYFACGIRSTGISTSPAVGEHVAHAVAALRGWDRPRRAAAPASMTFDGEAGRVICPCRSVSAGEVALACDTGIGARTLDAVKRASGAMFGDCQGNRCAAAVATMLAERSAADDDGAILKGGTGSWTFVPITDVVESESAQRGASPDRVDLLIIGAGLTGIGAAAAAVAAGQRVVVVEREKRLGGAFRAAREALTDEERAAVAEVEHMASAGQLDLLLQTDAVGLVQGELENTWTVLLQADQAFEIKARRVILACGGYTQPREHLAVDGPRSAGIWTADAAHAALDAGWLPARNALVVGSGRFATATARRLEAAGCSVTTLDGELQAVRGAPRLTAASIDGRWHDGDALFMARRLVPAPFLLRPLGLVDNLPGSLPVMSDDGSVAGGLSIAGSCRTGDIDHVASLADGRRVAAQAVSG